MAAKKTDNEKVARFLSKKTGVPLARCMQCIHSEPIKGTAYRISCLCPVALAISKTMVRQPEDNDPHFPLLDEVNVETGEVTQVPSIVASEYGYEFKDIGALRWPEIFDPEYIFFCMMYQKKEDK